MKTQTNTETVQASREAAIVRLQEQKEAILSYAKTLPGGFKGYQTKCANRIQKRIDELKRTAKATSVLPEGRS